MEDRSDAFDAVVRLAEGEPEWIPAVRAALALADRGAEPFAGAWILQELEREQAQRTWYPNFRRLVTLGVLEKDGRSTRQGQRAYYRVRDPAAVRRALASLDAARSSVRRRLGFTAVGRSGRSDLSARANEILDRDFPHRPAHR